MKKFTILSLSIVFLIALSFQSFGQTVEFFVDFESGTDNWELTGDWGLTEEFAYSATHSMTDSPGGDYAANQDTYCTMATGVDLSDAAILSAAVSFWSIYDIENSIDFDWVKVQASDDDFANWADIGIFNGEGNLDPWIEYSYSLGAFIGSDNVKVRFHFHSDGGYEVDGIYFDDFEIVSSDVDDASPYIGYDNPPTFYEGSLEEYVFEVELIDASGIASTTVYYQVEEGDWLTVDGINTSGDIYEYTIPTQTPGSLIDFYIEAVDGSANANVATSPDYKYISGAYWYYDDPEDSFYVNFFAGQGASVVFTLLDNVQIVTGLIRNYQDQSNPPNKNFMFHVWTAGASGPGDDMITPFEVTPAATPADPNPMTVVDLRDYAEELSGLSGDVFIGFTVDEDTVRITEGPNPMGRSFYFDGSSWNAESTYNYHFRLITTASATGITPVENAEPSAIVFPNPASDILYVESNSSKIKTIHVINTTGQIVYSNEVNAMKTQIEINSLNTGVYFVQVETDKGIKTQKIIIK